MSSNRSHGSASKTGPSSNDGKQKRILVVDDEPDITHSLRKGLEQKGFHVDTFNDSVKALDRFSPNSYDLVILDVRMPKMNGFDLYRELKKLDGNVKIWFLTAFEVYYAEFRRLFANLDVKSFIRKPISIGELAARIDGELGEKKT